MTGSQFHIMYAIQIMYAMSTRRVTRQEAKAQTREAILDAAAVVFARRGFAAASVQEIAEEAGRTTGALYAHFATKQALFQALQERSDHHRGEAAARAARQLDGATVEHFGALFDQQLDDPMVLLNIEFWLHAVRNDDARPAAQDRQRASRENLARLLAGLYDRERAEPPVPAERLAALALALAEGLNIQRQLEPHLADGSLFAEGLRLLTRTQP